MNAKVQQLRTPTTRTPEREKYAEALERYNEREKEHTAITQAFEGTWRSIHEAQTAIKAAEARVETAKSDAADFLVAQSLGQAGDQPKTVRACLTELEDAHQHLETVRGVRAKLETEKRAAELRLQTARLNRDEARRAVINAEITQLVND